MASRKKHEVIEEAPEIEVYTSDKKISEEDLLVADRLLAGILVRMWLQKRRKSAEKSGGPLAESA